MALLSVTVMDIASKSSFRTVLSSAKMRLAVHIYRGVQCSSEAV